ncbi:LigB family dioxygenase [Duganella sp. HH105]|nr:LigB family dioxygenase [Duganella sp. HH105]
MHALPSYFLSHGGGPWPFMMDQVGHLYGQLDASLRDIPRQLGVTPKAVLVITAHWEGRDFTVSSSARPPMIYDYGGFPPHTYEVQYKAPGAPELAAQVKQLLDAGGFSRRNSIRSAASTTAPSAPCIRCIRMRTCPSCSCRSSTASIR